VKQKRLRARVSYTLSFVGEACITGEDVEQILEAVENAVNYPAILKHLGKNVDGRPYQIEVFDMINDDTDVRIDIPKRDTNSLLNVNGTNVPPPRNDEDADYKPMKVSFKCAEQPATSS
jgi:hypothetical protein